MFLAVSTISTPCFSSSSMMGRKNGTCGELSISIQTFLRLPEFCGVELFKVVCPAATGSSSWVALVMTSFLNCLFCRYCLERGANSSESALKVPGLIRSPRPSLFSLFRVVVVRQGLIARIRRHRFGHVAGGRIPELEFAVNADQRRFHVSLGHDQ